MSCVRHPKGLEVSEPGVCRPFLLPAHTGTHGGGARVCRVALGFVALFKTENSVIQLLKQFSFLVSKKHKAAFQKGWAGTSDPVSS